VAEVGAGNAAPQKKELFEGGTHPFIRTSDVGQIRFGRIAESANLLNEKGIKKLRLVPKGSILMPKSGASTFLNHRVETAVDAYVSSHLATITAKAESVLPRYLLYYLSTVRAQDLIQDHKYPSLTLGVIGSIEVALPALEEQKRIVAVLDRAFAAVGRARALAEANLADAEELFETSLAQTFQNGGAGWSDCKVGDLITLQRGHDITKKNQRSGNVPVVSSGGIGSYHDEAVAAGPGVIVGRKGSIGSVHYVEDAFWPHDTTLYVKDFKGNHPLLVSYMMRGLKLAELDTGAANPSLNRNLVHPLKVSWPTDLEQSLIAGKLQKIERQAMDLAESYRRKLNYLVELRHTILQRAFAGELT
jgi:type I restriction enzyme S subunit